MARRQAPGVGGQKSEDSGQKSRWPVASAGRLGSWKARKPENLFYIQAFQRLRPAQPRRGPGRSPIRGRCGPPKAKRTVTFRGARPRRGLGGFPATSDQSRVRVTGRGSKVHKPGPRCPGPWGLSRGGGGGLGWAVWAGLRRGSPPGTQQPHACSTLRLRSALGSSHEGKAPRRSECRGGGSYRNPGHPVAGAPGQAPTLERPEIQEVSGLPAPQPSSFPAFQTCAAREKTKGLPWAAPSRRVAGATRLELATSGVTGRRSNRLNYAPAIRVCRSFVRW